MGGRLDETMVGPGGEAGQDSESVAEELLSVKEVGGSTRVPWMEVVLLGQNEG